MAQFERMIITNGGVALNARSQVEGTNIVFTSIYTCSGVYSSAESAPAILCERTSLKSVKQVIDVASVERTDGNTIRVRGVLSNENVTSNYKLSAIGLYAKIGNETPILYAVSVASHQDTIYAYDGRYKITATITLHLVVSNFTNIQTTLYTGAYASAMDLIDANQKITMFQNALASLNTWYQLTATIVEGSANVHPYYYLIVNPALKLMNLTVGFTLDASSNSVGFILRHLPVITPFERDEDNMANTNCFRQITFTAVSESDLSPQTAVGLIYNYNSNGSLAALTEDAVESKIHIASTAGAHQYYGSLLIPYKELCAEFSLEDDGVIVQEGGLFPGTSGYEIGNLIANDDGNGTVTLTVGGE